jgi:YetA-like protein
VSVPLPPGLVAHATQMRVTDPAGRDTLLQHRTLERWPDGSLRWVRLDFLADVDRGASATYHLSTGGAPRSRPRAGIHPTPGRDGTVVDTGACRIRPRDEGGVIVEIATTAGLNQLPIPLPTVETDVRARAPDTVALRAGERGPVRVEWLFAGHTAEGMAFETRISAFAGGCLLRIEYTLVNTAPVASTAALRRVALTLPLTSTRAVVGIDGEPRMLATLVPAREVRQLDATTAFLDTARDGKHLDGWVHAAGPDLVVTAAVQHLWQQFPAGFRVAPAHLSLDLVAAPETPLRFGIGAAKTFEAWLAVAPAPPAPAAAGHGTPPSPLVATVTPTWIRSTGALPHALAADSEPVNHALARLTAALDHYRATNASERWDDGPPGPCDQRTAEQPRVGTYGLLNWGDWNFPRYRDDAEGCDAWGNLEYDLPQVLGLLWAATGNAEAREEFEAAARHYRDVDIIHAMPAHPDWVGMNHPHKMSHFAVEAPNQIDLGHTWVEGLLTHYRLTGEARSLAAARGIANVLATRVDKAGNPRQLGWPLIALTAIYNATGEQQYLGAARQYATRALASVQPTPAAGDWKVGILADGLAYYDAATHDPATRQWLTDYAEAWLAARARFPDPRYALPLGYLAAATGNATYRRAAMEVAATINVGTWGKTFAATGRTLIRLLAPLERARGATLPVRADPPPASASAPQRSSRSPSGPFPRTAH